MHQIIFNVILTIVIFDFIFEKFLEYLNTTKWSNVLPTELSGIYDAQKYKKQQEYERENLKLDLIQSSLSFIIILSMLFLGGFAFIDLLARNYFSHAIPVALLFFGIMMFASDIINTPFSYYDTFVIEKKYGFNKTTLKTFILDKLKGWLLMAIIGGLLLSVIIWFYMVTGKLFWFYAWIVFSVFTLFMTMFYSNLIVPLFNKQKPLEEGELRNAIEKFSKKAGFNLSNIFVIDGSKRSTKANAYFTGLGSKKRIVLYDTLINDLTTDEIVAVLAHEIGHYKKKHTLSSVVLTILNTGITLFILSLFINNPDFSKALGSTIPSFHLGLISFGILYSPVSMIIGLGLTILSRKNEFEADRFAKEHTEAMHLINALKKLSINNLSNLTPHPLYVFFHYSHPPLLKRIEKLNE